MSEKTDADCHVIECEKPAKYLAMDKDDPYTVWPVCFEHAQIFDYWQEKA